MLGKKNKKKEATGLANWIEQALDDDAPLTEEVPKDIEAKLKKLLYVKTVGKYPMTVAEVLDDKIKYRAGTDECIESFKALKPWVGTEVEMQAKFAKLNADLSKVYDVEEPKLFFYKKPSCYVPGLNIINICPNNCNKYSVLTYLHEFGHALGKKEGSTCKWSINLFKKHFPKVFDSLEPRRHMLYRKSAVQPTKPAGD